jgi:hypothetical protein
MGTITRGYANLITADGPNAVASGSIQAADLAAGVGGKVLQVVSTTKTDTFSTSSLSYVDVTGLSVSITPSSVLNKILILINVDGSNSGGGMAIKLLRNSTDIAIGTGASGNRINVTLCNYYETDSNTHRSSGLTFLDTPSTTSSITYKLQSRLGTAGTGNVNRSTGSDDQPYNMFAPSTITVMEIAT